MVGTARATGETSGEAIGHARRLATGAMLAVAFAASMLGAKLVLGMHGPRAVIPWSLLALLGAALCLALLKSLLHHRTQWDRPLRQLEAALRDVRQGLAPIDELEKVDGELAPLAGQFREVLRELRQQKAEVMRLEEETRQRVAQRTDAMQRIIAGLRQQAIKDPLTGLYNRRMLDRSLPTLIDRCREAGVDLCLLMCDVDCFKNLNDTLGHSAGDELLRNVAQLVRSTVRDQDLPFRYGGDEFVVLMPGTGTAGATALAERLVSLVDGLARTLRVDPPPRLSVGITAISLLGSCGAAELLADGDKRLYAQKAQRRSARGAAA